MEKEPRAKVFPRSKTLVIMVKDYAKIYIQVFWFCKILLDFFTFFKYYFCSCSYKTQKLRFILFLNLTSSNMKNLKYNYYVKNERRFRFKTCNQSKVWNFVLTGKTVEEDGASVPKH